MWHGTARKSWLLQEAHSAANRSRGEGARLRGEEQVPSRSELATLVPVCSSFVSKKKSKSWTLEGIRTVPSDSGECLILDEGFGAQVPSGENWCWPEAAL